MLDIGHNNNVDYRLFNNAGNRSLHDQILLMAVVHSSAVVNDKYNYLAIF